VLLALGLETWWPIIPGLIALGILGLLVFLQWDYYNRDWAKTNQLIHLQYLYGRDFNISAKTSLNCIVEYIIILVIMLIVMCAAKDSHNLKDENRQLKAKIRTLEAGHK